MPAPDFSDLLDVSSLEGPSSPPSVQAHLNSAAKRTQLVSFLLQASVELARVFGPKVRYALSSFEYPDEPDARELHLVIDTDAPPEQACGLLDQLCEDWWDEAGAELDFEFYPVLGVIDHERGLSRSYYAVQALEQA